MLYDSEAGVDMPVEKRNLGLVFQSYALWPHRSVFDNVAYGLRLRGIPASAIDQRVHQALTNLGLIDEYQLLIHPIVLGTGKPLFAGIEQRVNLKLVNSTTFPSGVVVLTYQQAEK